MSTEGNIAIAGALLRALGRVPEAKKEEETYLFNKQKREDDAAFAGEMRDRQRQDWNDADTAAQAAMQEHLSDVMEARKYTPPGEFMDEQTRLVDTDGDGIPDSQENHGPAGGGAPALSALSLAVSPGKATGKGASTTPTTAALERVGGKALPGGPGVGIPGPGKNDPGKTLLGTYGMSAGYQATRKRLGDLYSSLHGRAEEIAKEYETAVAKATTDDQRRAALMKLSKRWSGIKPKFDDLTDQVTRFQHDMMVSKFAKQQQGLMMEMQGIPVDPAERGPWLDNLYKRYGDVLNEHQVRRELLENAKITPITYPVGDKMEQDGVLVDLGNGNTFVPQALAGWASGMMSAEKVLDTTAQARQKAIQMKAYDAEQRRQTEMQKASLRLQAAALGGGRQKMTPAQEKLAYETQLQDLKNENQAILTADWNDIDWSKVPKGQEQAALKTQQKMKMLAELIPTLGINVTARKADNQAKRWTEMSTLGRMNLQARLAKDAYFSQFMKPGSQRIPDAKQDKKFASELQRLSREAGVDPEDLHQAMAAGMPQSVMQNGVLHLSSGLPQ